MCERFGCWSSDFYTTDACDWGFNGTVAGVFDGANTKLNRRCVNVVSGNGRLDGMWMKGNTRRCLMCGVWIDAVICGMHDVMDSGGEMWDGNGRCLELNGSVSGG